MYSFWLHEAYLNRLVDNWYKRAIGQNVSFDVFDRFVSLWIAFNAWGTHTLGKNNDRNMIEAAKKDHKLFDSFQTLIKDDTSFVKDLNVLKTKCPIPRNRIYKDSKNATITNVNDFPEVLEVIYTIRCNLFHGKKLFEDPKDRKLVELAFNILKKVFKGVRPNKS